MARQQESVLKTKRRRRYLGSMQVLIILAVITTQCRQPGAAPFVTVAPPEGIFNTTRANTPLLFVLEVIRQIHYSHRSEARDTTASGRKASSEGSKVDWTISSPGPIGSAVDPMGGHHRPLRDHRQLVGSRDLVTDASHHASPQLFVAVITARNSCNRLIMTIAVGSSDDLWFLSRGGVSVICPRRSNAVQRRRGQDHVLT